MKIACTFTIAAAVFLTGCMGPNILHVNKGGVTAYGDIYWKREKIGEILINPQDLSSDQKDDLWVGVSPTNHMTFSEITETSMKKIAVPATKNYPASGPNDYDLGGYFLNFKDGILVRFGANRYGFPPKDITAFTQIGSRKNGSELSLPCSLNDFENVFGKADSVSRSFSW